MGSRWGALKDLEIPVRLIKEYFFCPRIPYIVLFSSYDQQEFEFMEIAKMHQDEIVEGFCKKYKAKLIAKEVFGKDKELKIFGKIDAIISTEEGAYVLEVKEVEDKGYPYEGHFYQALAYAKIALSLGYKVRGAIIYYSPKDRIYKVELSKENLNALRTVVRIIRRIGERGVPEMKSGRCSYCSYSKFCSGISHHGHRPFRSSPLWPF